MNQIVTDVVEITHHTISRRKPHRHSDSVYLPPVYPHDIWVVVGHGPDGFTQDIDYYTTLEQAQADYPQAWCRATETGIFGH